MMPPPPPPRPTVAAPPFLLRRAALFLLLVLIVLPLPGPAAGYTPPNNTPPPPPPTPPTPPTPSAYKLPSSMRLARLLARHQGTTPAPNPTDHAPAHPTTTLIPALASTPLQEWDEGGDDGGGDGGGGDEAVAAPLSLGQLALIDEVCLDCLESVLSPGDSTAEWLVRKALQRDGRELGNKGRQMVARRCLGITSLRGRLEFMCDEALRKADAPPLSLRGRARLLLGLYIIHHEAGLGRESDLKRGLLGGDPALWSLLESVAHPETDVRWPSEEAAPAEALAAKGSLPLWLAETLIDQYGATEAAALADEANKPGPVTLRWNPLRCPATGEEERGGRKTSSNRGLLARLAKEGVLGAVPSQWSPYGIRLTQGRPPNGLWGLSPWREGMFEVQDEGSQLIALAAGVRPGEGVLDICAGNGGKSLAMGSCMAGQGRLWVYDTHQSRLRHLEAGAKRAGMEGLVTVLGSEAALDGLLMEGGEGICDVVLVDAPCSSSGVLRRRPSLRWTLEPQQAMVTLPSIQRALMVQAQAHVRVGGRLVYATCSLFKEENAEVTDWFLEEFGARFRALPWTEAPLLAAAEAWAGRKGEEGREVLVPGTLHLLPHVHGTDGFYMARFERYQ